MVPSRPVLSAKEGNGGLLDGLEEGVAPEPVARGEGFEAVTEGVEKAAGHRPIHYAVIVGKAEITHPTNCDDILPFSRQHHRSFLDGADPKDSYFGLIQDGCADEVAVRSKIVHGECASGQLLGKQSPFLGAANHVPHGYSDFRERSRTRIS